MMQATVRIWVLLFKNKVVSVASKESYNLYKMKITHYTLLYINARKYFITLAYI